MKTSNSDERTVGEIDIINAFVSGLKKIGINSDIKIFEDEATYIFYITDEREEEKYQNDIGVLAYKFNKKYYNKIKKMLMVDFLFGFFSDVEKYEDVENSKFAYLQKDITNEITEINDIVNRMYKPFRKQQEAMNKILEPFREQREAMNKILEPLYKQQEYTNKMSSLLVIDHNKYFKKLEDDSNKSINKEYDEKITNNSEKERHDGTENFALAA